MSVRNVDSKAAAEPVPILLIAGLPRAGKTAVSLHVRTHCGGRLAVVEREQLDARAIAGIAQALACNHDAVLLELPAFADLAEIAAALGECPTVALHSVVTVIDACSLLADFCSKELLVHRYGGPRVIEDQRSLPDALTELIELANVIVLNKLDCVSANVKPGLVALVTALNPGATILEAEWGRVVPGAIVQRDRFDLSRALELTGWALTLADAPIPDAEQHGISTLLYRERRPFHPARLAQLLGETWPGVVRAKGLFWVASRPQWSAELSQAGASRRYRAVTSWWAATLEGKPFEPEQVETFLGIPWDPTFGDRRQELAFVGIHLDVPALKARLDACLLDDAEVSRGWEVWQTYPDPFPPWGQVATTRAANRYH